MKRGIIFICISFLSSLQLIIAQANNLQWLDIELSNYSYPYPVSELILNSQNQELKMAYMDVQPANYNGKNIVLLHGKNFNGAYWKTTIDALTKEGFRVVVPDQIGFGKSSKPLHYQYTFQQLALNTKVLLDTLKISQTTILGHSMGGMLATRVFSDVPRSCAKIDS